MTIEEIREKRFSHSEPEFQRMKERYRFNSKIITPYISCEIEKILAKGDRVELIPVKNGVKIIRVRREEIIPGSKR